MFEAILVIALASYRADEAWLPPHAGADTPLTLELPAPTSVPLEQRFLGDGTLVEESIDIPTRAEAYSTAQRQSADASDLARRWRWFSDFGIQQRNGSRTANSWFEPTGALF